MSLRSVVPYVMFALVAALLGPLVFAWWAQVVAVFFGRRDLWWDAEDFGVFYAAGRLVASGDGHVLYSRTAFGAEQALLRTRHDPSLNFYNPAFFALVFAPLSLLSFSRAFQAWTLINLCLLAACSRLTWQIAAPFERRWRFLIVAALVTCYPVTFALRLGQFSLILLAGWSAAFLLLRAGRDRAAGVALAVLLIKPELLVPIALYLAIKRRPAALATFAPLAVLAIVASVGVTGIVEAVRYPGYIHDSAFAGEGNMYGWNGILAASISPYRPGTVTAPAALLSLITLGSAAIVWSRSRASGGETYAREWLLVGLVAMLADGHFYLQDTMLLAPGVVALIAAARGIERATVAGCAAIGWLMLGLGNQPSQSWHANIFGWYAVLATAGLVAHHMLVSRAEQYADVAELPRAA